MRPSRLRGTVSLLALCALGGCGVLSPLSNPKPPPPDELERKSSDYGPVAPLLQLMSELPQGDPARQAELFQSAKDQASLSPTTSNRLKYAVALATPGHSGSDPVAAQRQLSELLARPETLLPDERLLALVELQDVDQRLILQAENQRLRDEASQDSRDKLQAANRRLQAESDENARLRKALDEARDRKSTRLNSSHSIASRMPSSA